MQIARIYTAQQLQCGQQVVLDKKASQHLLRVLRAKFQDPVIIFNGKGGEFRGQLVDAEKGLANIKLLQYENVNRESPLAIHLAQGISRGERMDYVIQKATELGVVTITPLFTERCTVKLSGARLEKRLEHWRSVAIAACEQSGRCQIPHIKEAEPFNHFVSDHAGFGFICNTESGSSIESYQVPKKQATLLIGPEGGFANAEVQAAQEKNFHSLSLGPRILRTETAPIVAMTLLQSCAGDL